MSAGFLFLLSLAFACAAAAFLLWSTAGARHRRELALRRLKLSETVDAAPAAGVRIPPGFGLLSVLARRLEMPPGAAFVMLVLAPAPLLALLALALGGPAVGAVALVLFSLVTIFALALRRAFVQKRVLRAVPGFVDAMVRTIVIGQSPAAAFQAALHGTQGPLRRALGLAERLMAAGADLDVAITQTGRIHGSEALLLLGSVMRMSTHYGGRADQVLERLATFLRDRQEAEEELSAVSAETRMSAWILGALPVAVTLLILFANSAYLAGMWSDASGRKLLLGAFVLEMAGAYLLYRLARLR